MALINCNECNAQISDKANNCPKCGAPVTVKIKCFECGVELDKGTKSCSNCGVEQDLNEVIKKEPANKSAANSLSHDARPKSNSKRLMWILFGLVLIILFLVFALANRNSSPSIHDADNAAVEEAKRNTGY
jgi:uncharacterized membrane protein YvbJ